MAPTSITNIFRKKINYLKPLYSDSPITAYLQSILQVANKEVVLK